MIFKDVPIPKRMRGLQRDRRGYPIPFNVQRDIEGRPHFTITDTVRQHRCIVEGRCPICGNRLLEKPWWYVGGPMSAFHEYGCYNDTALHHDCMTYSLQVCPWLSIRNYVKRIDAGTVDPTKLPVQIIGFQDITTDPDRPLLFVAVAANSQTVQWGMSINERPTVRPTRPYLAVEYWQNGIQITAEQAAPIIASLDFTSV